MHRACLGTLMLLGLGAGEPPSAPAGETSPNSWPVPNPDASEMQPAVAQRLAEVREEVVAHPASVTAWSKLGGMCDAYQAIDCAATAYERARTLAPDDFRWPYLLAIVITRSKPVAEEAERLLRIAIDRAPAYAPAHYHLGLVLAKQGDREGAAAEYRKTIELNPDLALPHRSLGQLLLAKGDTAGATTALERAVRLNPNDGEAYAALTQAYGRAGDREKARNAATTARRLRPVNTMEDPIRAQVLAEAVNMPALEERIRSLLRDRKFEEAMPLLELVEALRPNDPDVLRALARANRALNRPGSAENYMARVLEAKPDLVDVRIALARLLAEQGRNDEAIQQFERALTDAPKRNGLRLALAGLLLQTNRFQESAEQFEQADKLSVLDAGNRLLYGEALLRNGDFEGARVQLDAVANAEPMNAEAHFLLAKAYQGLGDQGKAKAHLQRAVRIERERGGDDTEP